MDEKRGASGSPKADRGGRALPLLLLVALYGVTVAVYVLLGRRQAVPLTTPDEFTYGRLARSVADGEGLTWRGASEPLRSALYVYAIAPAWLADDLRDAYANAKVIGAVLVSLAVVPTYLLSRRYLGRYLSLAPAALAVAGTWMMTSAGILTENLAYPLATATLAATVVAVTTPGSRWSWIAVGLAIVTSGVRLQLAVLLPVILGAVLVDAARCGAGWRGRLRAHRSLALTTGALTLAGGVFALASRSAALGSYEGVDMSPPLADVMSGLWRESTALLTLSGFVALFVAVAASCRRATWRDVALGPLLSVLWASVALMLVESAWAMQGFAQAVDYQIERYVQYVLPLLFVAAVAVLERRIVPWRWFAAASVVGLALLVPVNAVRNRGEERALLGTVRRVSDLLGTSTGISVALAAFVAAGLMFAVLAAARRGRLSGGGLAVATLFAVTAGLFVVQQQLGWRLQIDIARSWRAGFPSDLAWIDTTAGGPVARLVTSPNPARAETTEFFNRAITQVYVPDRPVGGRRLRGKTCVWTASATGALGFQPGCGPAPSRFLLADDWGKTTLHGQRVLADAPGVGRVVDIPPPSRPRIKAQLYVPCGPPLTGVGVGNAKVTAASRQCISPYVAGEFWLDEPATLRLRFRGGSESVQVSDGQHSYVLPAGRPTTLRFPLPAGQTTQAVTFDSWPGPPPVAPDLISATLTSRGAEEELLY